MLRRYRDIVLDNSWYGKIFIKIYYFISPVLVKIFGKTKWFKNYFRKKLDKKIAKLKLKGFSDQPYIDKY